jgi:hypothetical protein
MVFSFACPGGILHVLQLWANDRNRCAPFRAVLGAESASGRSFFLSGQNAVTSQRAGNSTRVDGGMPTGRAGIVVRDAHLSAFEFARGAGVSDSGNASGGKTRLFEFRTTEYHFVPRFANFAAARKPGSRLHLSLTFRHQRGAGPWSVWWKGGVGSCYGRSLVIRD